MLYFQLRKQNFQPHCLLDIKTHLENVLFDPHGQIFARKAAIRLPYKDSDNDGIIDGLACSEKNAAVFYFNRKQKNAGKAGSPVQILHSNTIVIKTDHLSTFIVAADIETTDAGAASEFK